MDEDKLSLISKYMFTSYRHNTSKQVNDSKTMKVNDAFRRLLALKNRKDATS